MSNNVIVIPAYNPDNRIFDVIDSVIKNDFNKIIVVNDGSNKNTSIFEEIINKHPNIVLLTHPINMGKGKAIKTAFSYILSNYPQSSAITIDCDGQLFATDAKTASVLCDQNPSSLILGYRDFKHIENLPKASFLGNTITRISFKLITGLYFSDTQCGLRGYTPAIMKSLISLKGDRFEFENNTLLTVRKENIPVIEFPVKVIYDSKENHSTNFHALKDSVAIYRNLLSFYSVPSTAFFLNLLCFTFFTLIKNNIILSLLFCLFSFLIYSVSTIDVKNKKNMIVSGIGISIFWGLLFFLFRNLNFNSLIIVIITIIPQWVLLQFVFKTIGFNRKRRIMKLN